MGSGSSSSGCTGNRGPGLPQDWAEGKPFLPPAAADGGGQGPGASGPWPRSISLSTTISILIFDIKRPPPAPREGLVMNYCTFLYNFFFFSL